MPKSTTTTKPIALLSVATMARRADCSEKTIRRAIDAGHLRTVPFGARLIRATEDDFNEYLARTTGIDQRVAS